MGQFKRFKHSKVQVASVRAKRDALFTANAKDRKIHQEMVRLAQDILKVIS